MRTLQYLKKKHKKKSALQSNNHFLHKIDKFRACCWIKRLMFNNKCCHCLISTFWISNLAGMSECLKACGGIIYPSGCDRVNWSGRSALPMPPLPPATSFRHSWIMLIIFDLRLWLSINVNYMLDQVTVLWKKAGLE